MATGLRLAFGHQARVGKDTVADYIIANNGPCVRLAFATKLYQITDNIQNTLGMSVEKDANLLQKEGSLLRDHYGGDIFVNKLIEDMTTAINNDPTINVIITDVRYLNEFEALKKLGFTIVKITRDNRVINRDSNHTSETSLVGAKFDMVIDNNGTLQDLYSQVDSLIKKIILNDN